MEFAGSGRKASETLAALQKLISTGEWPVNTRIPKEAELMAMFDVGKSTVREAVRSLASMGMLEPIKGVGTFVRSRTPVSSVVSSFVSAYSVDELLDFRRALEMEAAQLAAVNRSEDQLAQLRQAPGVGPRHDPEAAFLSGGGQTPGTFHQLIFEASGNSLMSAMYAALMAPVRKLVGAAQVVRADDDDLRRGDHAAILRAIEARDPDAARVAMRLHVDRDLVPAAADAAGSRER